MDQQLGMVAQKGGVVAQKGGVVAQWYHARLLSSVPGSNPASPQLTSDCQSPGGLPPGMALSCRLTSVRGNRGENYEK